MKGSKQESEAQSNSPKGIAGTIDKKSKVKVVDVGLAQDDSEEVAAKSKGSAAGKTRATKGRKAASKKSAASERTSKTASSASKKKSPKKTVAKKSTKSASASKAKSKTKSAPKTAGAKKVAKKATKSVAKKTSSKTTTKKAASKKTSKKATPTARKAKTSSKKAAAGKKSAKETKKASKPTAETPAPKKKAVARSVKKVRRGAKTKARAATEEATKEQPTKIASPTLAALKPFREAAKANKKRQKEKARRSGKKNSFLAKPPRKGKKYTVDLRIHTPASLGFFSTGGVDPAPALVRLAKVKGLNMIGLTDWFSANFVDEVKSLAEASGVTIIPGLDMRCKVSECDEITITALFPEHYGSEDLNRVLTELNVPTSVRGRRDYCLSTSFGETVNTIESNEGCIIPSRIDKTPFRHLAIPTMVEEYGFHAFDLVHPENPEFFKANWPDGEFTFFSFSNANALGQVGSRTSSLKLTESGYAGLKGLVQRR